jgi:hypothetical protein
VWFAHACHADTYYFDLQQHPSGPLGLENALSFGLALPPDVKALGTAALAA